MPTASRAERFLERIQIRVEGGLTLSDSSEFARQILEDVRAEADELGAQKQLSGFFSRLDAMVLQLSKVKANNSATAMQARILEKIWDELRAAR